MKKIDPLVRQVQTYSGLWQMLPQGGTVLCAVSGGRDSIAMLHILSRLSEEIGFQVAAAHYHHGLREAAGRDEAFVREWCQGKGIPLTVGYGDVRSFARRKGLSTEDAARTLRYAFLEDTAKALGAERIAVAHHREDNAETLLLHLLRGAGLHGLCGISPVRGKIVRPMLNAGREEINAYIERNGLSFVEDETNQDAVYTRNRLRLEVMPLLEEIAPGCAARMASAAALLREEDDHLQREADALLPNVENGEAVLPDTVLKKQDEAMRRRLVRSMGRRLGVELTRAQTEAALSLNSGGFLDLPCGICAYKRQGLLVIKARSAPLSPQKLNAGIQTWGTWRVKVIRMTAPAAETSNSVVLRDTGGELSIASWDGTGRLAVENGSRTMKRLFTDAGIPIDRRAEHPAILLDGEVAAIVGVAADWTLHPADGEYCWVVTLEKGGAE